MTKINERFAPANIPGFESILNRCKKLCKIINPKSNNKLTFKDMATSLEDEIKRSSKVFIVGHNNPDLDSIGSAIGIQHLATSYGKKAYIIVGDDERKIDPGAKKLIDDNREKHKIINMKKFEKKVDENSFLIMTDVNDAKRTAVGDHIDSFSSKFIIDHHEQNENTTQANHMYIDQNKSSASEIVAEILNSKKNKIPAEVATALLAGIKLDSDRFGQNTSDQTLDVARKLIKGGANNEYVSKLLLLDLDTRFRISGLYVNGTVLYKLTNSTLSPIQVAITFNRNSPETIYYEEDFAKLADELKKSVGVDAAFVMGYIESGLIKICARDTRGINVAQIMHEMNNGGGKPGAAATKIHSDDIFAVEKELLKQIKLGISGEEQIKLGIENDRILEEPKVEKVYKI